MIDLLKKKVKEAIFEIKSEYSYGENFDIEKIKIEISSTKEYKFGDYSSNIAMILAGKINTNPLEVAEKIVKILGEKKIENVSKIKIVQPGYINFYLTKKYFAEFIDNIIIENEKWGQINILKNKRYIFEHSSPNLFKPFHIGHLVNNAIGESLVRIINKAGADVRTLSFPSNISPGIAKTIWAIRKKGWDKEITIKNIGKAYVFGVAKYKDDDDARKQIDNINKKLYLEEDFDGLEIYKIGQKISLDYFKKVTTRLGTKFDNLIFESEAEVIGKEIVKKNIPKIFKQSNGAVIFPGSKYGLFDNVFINSAGFGTYLAKDIGLLKIKFQKFNFDKSVTVTDIEQREHFQLVKKTAELINEEWAEKSEFIQHGRLRFSGGKISSRYGNVPLAEELLDSVKEKVFAKISGQNFSIEESEEIAEKIAIGALKYSILKSNAGKNIVFDFEKSIAFDGDSGPYLQYTFVRTRSVLDKIKFPEEMNNEKRISDIPDVEKILLKFPQAIERSVKSYSPHYLANYLHQLASEFNSFYAQVKILDKENKDYLQNVALTKAVNITLKNGLELLGIKAIDKM